MIEQLKTMEGVLDSFRTKKSEFIAQKEQTQVNFQQLVGAIFVLDNLIEQYSLKISEIEKTINGDNENGQSDCQVQECAA